MYSDVEVNRHACIFVLSEASLQPMRAQIGALPGRVGAHWSRLGLKLLCEALGLKLLCEALLSLGTTTLDKLGLNHGAKLKPSRA